MNAGPIVNLLDQGVGNSGVASVLRTVRKHLGMDFAFVAHFRETDRVFEHVDSDIPAPIVEGQAIPLEDGYCLKIVNGELPELIPDTSRVPAAMAIPATTELPIGSHLSIPIELASGEIYGTLCCFSHAPNDTLGERDVRMVRALGEVLASRIDEGLTVVRMQEQAASEIRHAIDVGAPRVVFQPIHALRTNRITGVECLSRFDIEPRRSPDVWFNAAHEAGLGLELELVAIQYALQAIGRLPEALSLSINASPELVLSGRLEPVLSNVNMQRIVLEVTEHATVTDYDALARALAPFRSRGARVAVDDAGAGYASMRHILDLHADIIKLDMSLTRNIDTDCSRRALAKGLVTFAQEIGSSITAEGVETSAELAALRAIGVDKVQGYYMSKPQTLLEVLSLVS